MNEQVEEVGVGGNIPAYSVGELSIALKRAVEENFGWVRVRGEGEGVDPRHLFRGWEGRCEGEG